jgi:multimeric flavodoxin WrbA
MKVEAFCGSAPKKGNTALLLSTVLDSLAQKGAETELVELAGTRMRGCKACFICFKEKDGPWLSNKKEDFTLRTKGASWQ